MATSQLWQIQYSSTPNINILGFILKTETKTEIYISSSLKYRHLTNARVWLISEISMWKAIFISIAAAQITQLTTHLAINSV